MALAGCGGGGSSSSGSKPTSVTNSASLSTTSSTTVTFPAIGGVSSGSITIPAASAATSASLKFSASLPGGVSSVAASTISPRSHVQTIGGGAITLYGVIALTVSTQVTIGQTPAFSFTLPSAPPANMYIAYFDVNNASAGWNVLLSGTVTGDTVAFAAQTIVPPLTFQPNDIYLFALIGTSEPATSTSATYNGTKSVSFQYGYAFGYPAPAPGATQPPSSLSYTVAANVGTGTATYPGSSAPAGSVDQNVTENDSSSLSTTTYSTDSWVTLSTATAPYTASLNATLQQEPSSANLPQIGTVWTTPQQVDEFGASGSPTWTNSPAGTVSYSYADSDNGSKVIASDGSYLDTENLLDQGAGGTVVLTENSDGSGSIVGPYFGGGIVDQVTMSASSGGNVTVTTYYSNFAQSQYNLPATNPITEPTWYTLPLKLYTETDGITPGVQLPDGCKPNSFGSSADDVNRTMTTLDTINGVLETTTLDSYEVNGTPICMTSTDTQNYAYNQQGNTPYFLLVGPLGMEIIITKETLVLANGLDAAASSARHVTSASGKSYTVSAVTAAIQGHQLTSIARDRAVHLRNFLQTVHSAKGKLSVFRVSGGAK